MIQYGFGPVSLVLLEHGLLDELQLWIEPQFVDATVDDLLFRPGVEATFDLRGTWALDNGIVIHTYAPHGLIQPDLIRIGRAIVEDNAYLTLATADARVRRGRRPSGSHDRYTRYVWVSRPEARHSRKVRSASCSTRPSRTGRDRP